MSAFKFFRVVAIVTVATVSVSACSTNPVTGKSDLLLVDESWELNVGKQNYLPLRQSQGGDYVVDPGVAQYVRNVGNRLAAKSDRKLPYEFNVINDSVPNAWALPGGKISINRGLLVELKNEAELAAVLGHEIVHAAAKHGARGQSRGVLLQGAVVAATLAGNHNGYGQAAQFGAGLAAQLTNSKYGRNAELESDFYGMQYMARAGYNPQGAVDLQRTFLRLSEGRRSDFISGLFASHPPSQERVEKNIATAKSLPVNGDLGAARYQAAMRRLQKTKAAYDLFDDAQKDLQNKNTAAALSKVNRAIQIEPQEGHFHSFLGDIERSKGNNRAARKYYDKAVSLNKSFYYYRVRRAQVNQLLGSDARAKSDYEYSMTLLPSAEAQFGLGTLEKKSGNIEKAKQYYAQAAQSNSPTGKKAMDALLSLDLSDNPQNYLLVNRGLTEAGTFAFQLINKTSRPLTGITLGVQGVGSNNSTRQSIGGTLAAGESKIIDTGRRMTKAQADAIRVVVLDVKVKN